MTVCNRCGKENQDHYKFCLGCGAELTAAPKPQGNDMGMMKTMMADPAPNMGGPMPPGMGPGPGMGGPMGPGPGMGGPMGPGPGMGGPMPPGMGGPMGPGP